MKKRRLSNPLDDMPGLFDSLNIEFDPDRVSQDRESSYRSEVIERARQSESGSLKIKDRTRSQLRFVSFGSGSSGNCSFIGTLECGLLIDAGVNADTVDNGLKANGIDADHIAGILLTHDHGDHVSNAYTLLRRHPHMKLFATPRNLNGVLRRHNISRRIRDYHTAIYKEFAFTVGSLKVTAFETSHDGSDNMGFAVESDGHVFVIVTDTGYITERSDYYIRQANHLVIESNYDSVMLARCNRPEYLKARIASEHGHMDNADTAAYLARVWTPQLTDIYLCHLSEDTNTPATALEAVRAALEAAGITVGDGSGSLEARRAQVQLSALPRFASSPLHIYR